MNLYTLTVNPFSENTYVLVEESKALLIDPGFYAESEFQEYKRILKSEEATLSAVVLTHAHVDHVLGLSRVLKDRRVPVYLNHSDLYLWENFPAQAGRFGFNVPAFDFTPEPLEVGEEVTLGPLTFDVRYTPGHAPDHVSLYRPQESILIAGDTLFKQSIGRTDLYKGDMEQLAKSIREQLYTLPDDTQVYPGHGPSTTIGFEKKNNSFVKAG
ncbi:MAG: MBL fold metallo-hydrolase [Bacteroidota bacterium]